MMVEFNIIVEDKYSYDDIEGEKRVQEYWQRDILTFLDKKMLRVYSEGGVFLADVTPIESLM